MAFNAQFDFLRFCCPHCQNEYSFTDAAGHAATCSGKPQFRPPSWIEMLADPVRLNRPTISNPTNRADADIGGDRLVVIHHNGNQIASKMIRASKPATIIKDIIAKQTDIDHKELKLYKFVHFSFNRLNPNAKIADICDPTGATHFTSYHNLDLDDTTALVSVEGEGPPPRVQRPMTPEEQW